MKFFGQGPQRFREQSGLGCLDGQLAGSSAKELAANPNDVSQIPGLECLVSLGADDIPLQKKLDPSGTILDVSEARFTHHTFGHQATANRNLDRFTVQRLLAVVPVCSVQLPGQRSATTVVGKCKAIGSHFGELASPFGDKPVFGLLFVAHQGTPVGRGRLRVRRPASDSLQ